jgi:hypothetical protein
MKPKSNRTVALYLALLGTAICTLSANVIGAPLAQKTQQIKIAGEDYDLLFESKSDLSNEAQEMISEDITLNLSHLTNINFRDVSQTRREPSQKYQRIISHWIDVGKQKRFYPQAMEKYFGGAFIDKKSYVFIMHNDLIAKYINAFKFKIEHEKEFKELDDFLSIINSPSKLDEIAQSPKVVRSMFFFPEKPSQSYNYVREFLGLKQMHVRKPSLLDFNIMEYQGKEIVYFSTLTWSTETATETFIMKGFPLFAFVEGKWRIYVPKLP